MTPVLIVFFLTIFLFIWNRIPMGTVSLLAMLALLILGAITPSEAYSFICNNTTLTMAAMFVLSSALVKTTFIARLMGLAEKMAARSFKGLVASYVLLAFILSQFIPSITAVFALLCPIIVSMCKKLDIKPRRILYSVALVITVSAYTLTPFGPYAANYLQNNTLQIRYGIEGFINSPFTEMILKLPPTVFVIIWSIFFAPKLTVSKCEQLSDKANAFAEEKCLKEKTQPSAKIEDTTQNSASVALPHQNLASPNGKNPASAPLTPFQNIVTIILFALTLASLVFSSFGLASWIIPCISSCIVICTGVLSEKEAISSLNLSVIIIYAGTSALGAALVSSGVAEKIGSFVISILSGTQNSYILGLVFFISAFVCTSLIYNRAVGRILIPIVLSTCYAINADPRGLVQMCYIGSMCSLMTPASTSLVPMIVESGGFTQRDLLRMGVLPSILLCVITVISGMTLYPCF